MARERYTVYCLLWMICSICVMGEESCRLNYGDNCFANSTLCSPYTVGFDSRCSYIECCCSHYSSEESLFNYVHFQYCSTWSTNIGLPKEISNAILMAIMCIYFVLILGNVADQYFAPIMAETADTLGVSHNIAGVTFLAFANGAPDISSSVAALSMGGEQTKLGIGALLGVAVFNPIFISSVISTYAVKGEPIKVVRFPFVRDCIFLFIAASLLLRLVLNGKVYLIEAILMIMVYAIYVTTAICSEIYNKKIKKKPNKKPSDVTGGTYQSLRSVDVQKDDEVDDDNNNQEYHPSVKHLWQSIKSEGVHDDIHDDIHDNIHNVDDDDNNNNNDKHCCLKVTFLILRGPAIISHYICQITVPLTDEEHWNDKIAIISCTTAPMWIFFVFELFHHDYIIPIWIFALLFGIIMSGITYYFCNKKYKIYEIMPPNNDISTIRSGFELTSKPKLSQSMANNDNEDNNNNNNDDDKEKEKLRHQPVLKYFFLLLGFVSSVAWINFCAVEVVNILSALGIVSTIDLAILGLTVLSWGNSTPDLVADVGVSKRGYARMGIAAAIGGPTLDILIGVGMGMTIFCINNDGEGIIPISTNLFFGCLGVMIGITSYLTSVACNKWRVTKYIGYFLFFYYITFLLVNIISYQADLAIV